MKRKYTCLLSIAALSIISVLGSCKLNCVKGSGTQTTETRKFGAFSKLEITGSYVVHLKQDSSQSITITADDNLLKYIKSSIEGDKLHISSKKNFCNTHDIVINIGVGKIDQIKATGAVEVITDGKLNTQDLYIKLTGASKVDMDLNAANVTTEGSGSIEINLKGQATSHHVELSGSGKIAALDFVVGNYDIETSGASHCQINVLHDLSVHTSGASEIQYRGNPTNISNDKSGASSLTKIN